MRAGVPDESQWSIYKSQYAGLMDQVRARRRGGEAVARSRARQVEALSEELRLVKSQMQLASSGRRSSALDRVGGRTKAEFAPTQARVEARGGGRATGPVEIEMAAPAGARPPPAATSDGGGGSGGARTGDAAAAPTGAEQKDPEGSEAPGEGGRAADDV